MTPDPVIAGLLMEIGKLEQSLGDPATAPHAARCIGTAASFIADLSAQRADQAVKQAHDLALELQAERAILRREIRRVQALEVAIVVLGLVLLGLGLFF